MFRDFFLGFVRLHILHHASRGPVFGLEMIKEMERHGYGLSPGTLYPILHHLEAKGYLCSRGEAEAGRVRRYYRTTEKGEAALREAMVKAEELLRELRE